MIKVFVTGATGFTGGHLARALNKKGYQVRCLVRSKEKGAGLESLGMELAVGDLTDKKSLVPALNGIDIVYHIAAVYREQNIPRKRFWEVNVEGTKNLLEASAETGIKRFVHCSTVGVQGEIENPPASENTRYNPGDYYQESKMEGELLALDFFKNRGLPGVVFRPVGIYGPGDTRFLKLFKFIGNRKFRMFGSGNVLYHLTYIDDLVDGIILVGETPGVEGEIFTIAGERYTTLNEFVETIAKVLNVNIRKLHYPVWPLWLAGALCEFVCTPLRISPPVYRRRVDFFIKDRAFDISKAKKVLGYNPNVSIYDGLKKTAEWYKKEGLI
ncbi:NAD-dependent epimerase/dehydratase family protein [bacterium]|nr:NAD-dependent epimerase/dehydratase family protein [bacterium]